MSAIFKRGVNDEGIEMPMNKHVPKSTLCTIFGLHNTVILYVTHLDGSIGRTLMGNYDAVIPTKPGVYFVTTAVERWRLLQKEEGNYTSEPIQQFDVAVKVNILSLPTELLCKIFSVLDCKTFGQLAQTCKEVNEIIYSHKFSIPTPLVVSFQFHRSMYPIFAIQKEFMTTIDRQCCSYDQVSEAAQVLKPFRLRAVKIDARDPSLPDDVLHDVTDLLDGISAEELIVEWLPPSHAAIIATKLEATRIKFKERIPIDCTYLIAKVKQTNKFHICATRYRSFNLMRYFDSFTPEKLPDLRFLQFEEFSFPKSTLEIDFFIRAVNKTEIILFKICEIYKNEVHLFTPLFELYLKNNWNTKIVQIEIRKATFNDNSPYNIIQELVQGRKWNTVQTNYPQTPRRTTYSAEIVQSKNGMFECFLLHAEQGIAKYGYITLTFGARSDNFWLTVDRLHSERITY